MEFGSKTLNKVGWADMAIIWFITHHLTVVIITINLG
jgi:hypothetical protein